MPHSSLTHKQDCKVSDQLAVGLATVTLLLLPLLIRPHNCKVIDQLVAGLATSCSATSPLRKGDK